jgi:hypothetical protein
LLARTTESRPGAGKAAPVPGATLSLLAAAWATLAEAAAEPDPGRRYAAAHLAALRAAAAVLAARARPQPRHRPTSAWSLLSAIAPEFAEWAAFFAAGAGKRAAAEAGLSRAVTAREADDLVRDVETFIGVVEARLGLPVERSLFRAG